MNSKFITLVFVALLTVTQCLIAQTNQKRELSAFTEVSLRIGANVHLKQGDTQSVEVKASASTLEKLITEVSDRKLVIRYSNEAWFRKWNPGPVDIYVTMPQIDGLGVNGSGTIDSEGAIESRILDLLVNGSGDISLKNLEAEKVVTTISGSGNIRLAGKQPAAELKAVVSGSGNVQAMDFPAEKVDAKIIGSGNCKVNALKNLVAKLAGSGNVIYRGNPAIDSSVAGSGTVKEEK